MFLGILQILLLYDYYSKYYQYNQYHYHYMTIILHTRMLYYYYLNTISFSLPLHYYKSSTLLSYYFLLYFILFIPFIPSYHCNITVLLSLSYHIIQKRRGCLNYGVSQNILFRRRSYTRGGRSEKFVVGGSPVSDVSNV